MTNIPNPADGEWLFTHQDRALLESIQKAGWAPERNTGSKYGCGIYLARGWWYADAPGALKCVLNVQPDEVIDSLPELCGFETHGAGNSEGHLARYLVAEGVTPGRPPTNKGSHPHNIAIRNHFLAKGIKVVIFREHDEDVCVVFEPKCIEIVELLAGSRTRPH